MLVPGNGTGLKLDPVAIAKVELRHEAFAEAVATAEKIGLSL
jgi:hypothetical protein